MSLSLTSVLGPLDWNANVKVFLSDAAVVQRIDAVAIRSATWAKQIEVLESGNLAMPFVREMQTAMFYSIVLMGLAMYKPAAGVMRSMFESALNYTYFRNHPAELATLVRDPAYFVQQSQLLEHHRDHTLDFVTRQHSLGLSAGIKTWYAKVSKLVHSQIPGSWIEHSAMKGIVHVGTVLEEALDTFVEGTELTHKLFLCTLTHELWIDILPEAKKVILRGMSGSVKGSLGLDEA
jgi:hypothetical protein